MERATGSRKAVMNSLEKLEPNERTHQPGVRRATRCDTWCIRSILGSVTSVAGGLYEYAVLVFRGA